VKNPRVVAIIPARGGSKGVLRKNIKVLAGKPLIAHSIEQAIKSELINEVYVSTEDKEISEISKKYGANTIYRPPELAKDLAKTMDVLKHACYIINADYIVLLEATSPMRKISTINQAIRLFINKSAEYDSLVTVKKLELKTGNISGKYYQPDIKGEIPRQLLDERYYQCGVIYIYKFEMMKEENIYGNRIMPFIIESDIEALDINTPEDFEIAEAISEKRNGKPD